MFDGLGIHASGYRSKKCQYILSWSYLVLAVWVSLYLLYYHLNTDKKDISGEIVVRFTSFLYNQHVN